MPWNQNGGPGGDPWGRGSQQGGGGPKPPDLDELVNRLKKKFGGGGPNGFKGWPYLGVIAFLLWGASGIYIVQPDEQGVVQRFGAFTETTAPGPHWHLPAPIETVNKVKVPKVERVEVGYRSRGVSDGFGGDSRDTVEVPKEALMLTGDENIVDINFTVQFRIRDAGNYLFNVRNPEKTVKDVAESAIREVVGKSPIDEVLTSGKMKIQTQTQALMQEILDDYKVGLQVVTVQLQQVQPPSAVIDAFKDVASAREDRQRAINEAHGYSNDILPKAKGEAAQMVEEAKAYKAQRVNEAQGDTERFLGMLAEYRKAPSVTTKRMYLETMEQVLGGVEKVVIDEQAANGVLPVLQLGGVLGQGATGGAK